MGLSNGILDQINGPGASEELALRRTQREQEAREAHRANQAKLENVALRNSGVVPPTESQKIHQPNSLPSDPRQFHIPDVEPRVTKTKTNIAA